MRSGRSALALLVLTLAISGCLVDVRLDADGSGKLTLRYHIDKNATLASIADRLTSPSVVVRAARVDSEGQGTFKLQFGDAANLSTTSVFKNVTVQHAPGTQPGTTDWTAKLLQPKPVQLPDHVIEHYGKDFTLTITFPGPVLATNATTHEGDHATWVIPLRDMGSRPETLFTVTYGPSAGS